MLKLKHVILFSMLILNLGCRLTIKPSPDPFYRAVLAQNADHEVALYAQAQTLRQQGQFKRARKYFAKLSRLSPQLDQAWIGLGQCELESGKYSEAAEAFEKALEIRNTEQGRLGLTSAYLLQGKIEQARLENRQTAVQFGESPVRLRLEGDIAFIDQNPAEALEAYRKSLELHPRQPKIQQRVRDLEDFLTATP